MVEGLIRTLPSIHIITPRTKLKSIITFRDETHPFLSICKKANSKILKQKKNYDLLKHNE